ncbi:hypothetical protein ACH5RR_015647 [Cinchona calisaya]|uniref:Uncharacterized protein n=1 Tax=Cinchona calisaya TaxID=153742 RepID=A0ABD2ZZ47_9GENT
MMAAFLACWLSGFTLPSMWSETIRPKTFFLVGKMTQGQIYDLATPLLAHLYRQLGHISNAKKLGQLLAGDNLIAKPYESSRFGRQFGYGQHCPQNVNTRCRDGLSLIALLQYWRRMHRHNTGARLITGIANGPGLVTLSYATCKTIDPRQSEGMHLSLVEDRLICSVEFFVDESSAQHGPTIFGSLDDFESFMSSLPSTKDIYNLFDNGVFVEGSGFLQTKRTKKVKRFPSCGIRDEPRASIPLRDLFPTNENLVRGKEVVSESVDKISSNDKEFFHLEDETDDELFDYAPLNDGTPDSVTSQQDPGTMIKEANKVLKFLANSPINVSHFYEILKDFIVKSHKLKLLGENRSLAYEARLEVTCSQLESLNQGQGKLVQDISSMKNSLNVLDGEINKLETNLSLLQTRRVAEA